MNYAVLLLHVLCAYFTVKSGEWRLCSTSYYWPAYT